MIKRLFFRLCKKSGKTIQNLELIYTHDYAEFDVQKSRNREIARLHILAKNEHAA
jgi:hypothetical protein